jgi:LPPG:FO 2-phospho-L-lactate transferase
VREALRETKARVAAVSPIVGGRALKGPADRMLRDQGLEASAVSIARLYEDFLDVLVIDAADEALAPEIEALGVDVVVTDTIMKSMEKKSALARTVLAALGAK